MKKGLPFVALAVCFSSLTSFASNIPSGNDLVRQCALGVKFMDKPGSTNQHELAQAIACFGYVAGVRDTMVAVKEACAPDNLEPGQIARLVIKQANDYPEVLNTPQFFVAAFAIQKSYPCAGMKKKPSKSPTGK